MSQTPDGTPFSNDMSGIPPPYGFPSNFDDLTESDLSAAKFDPFRLVAPHVEFPPSSRHGTEPPVQFPLPPQQCPIDGTHQVITTSSSNQRPLAKKGMRFVDLAAIPHTSRGMRPRPGVYWCRLAVSEHTLRLCPLLDDGGDSGTIAKIRKPLL